MAWTDTFDSNDIIDNRFDDDYLNSLIPDITSGDFSDPFWQTPDGMNFMDNINFDTPVTGEDVDYNWRTDGQSSGGNSGISSLLAKLGIDVGKGLIPNLADLGTHVMGLSDIYNKYDTDKDLKEMLAKSLYNTDDDYRMAFTGQATGLMDDRYNAGMNEQKLGMLYDIMMNRGDITKDQYNRRIGGLGQLTQGYEGMVAPQTNYLLDRRQDRFGDPYDPGTQPKQQTQQLSPFDNLKPASSDFASSIPANADPAQVAAYKAYLGIA